MVAAEFARLRAALERVLPEPTAPFRPPATAADLERLAAALGRPVPDDLAALLSIADGQDDPSWDNGPVNFHHFLGVDEIIQMHQMLDEVAAEWSEPEEQPSHYSSTGWSSGWIPFLAFQGDCFAIDTDPGELGVVGQVFARPNVPDLEEPKAPSLAAFLQRVVDLIDEGAFEVEHNSVELADLY
ncbi:SMI1/KNR4 family protein [Nocardioides sp. AE5]|uniref:SMI1/KNR4 family protein n=1 Tax=Nocardioides sp. AE5 TaxID=2962573 RepID=UPI002881212C|nr:SMI1/KNR4 family protein [Nocardioides sp. AE5]MDT0200355.1 SMI1/KNR4 family protein [Nocardioides sp. AE5]